MEPVGAGSGELCVEQGHGVVAALVPSKVELGRGQSWQGSWQPLGQASNKHYYLLNRTRMSTELLFSLLLLCFFFVN
jgi:hypothetical protein